ncbi:YolD-like family protein [Planococcus sp. YIM B11945]|uniref:YolD-like family protein n=1 Tax=Planococcus sp. YIM B11945 TaxID=3435410 RepID=UPI003D7C55AD
MKKVNKYLTVKGQIKDRGSIKWTAMMLTEHVQMLKDLKKEDRYNRKPDLDEFDLEAIHEEIQLAFLRQCEVEIHIWKEQFRAFQGRIASIDLQTKILSLETNSIQQKIRFDEIIGARCIE